MSIIVFKCQHYEEQHLQTLSFVHYAIFLVVKLDLFKQALLLECILDLDKNTSTTCVHLVIIISASKLLTLLVCHNYVLPFHVMSTPLSRELMFVLHCYQCINTLIRNASNNIQLSVRQQSD